MASREGGARPAGTDGNDFKHREKVASHYAIRHVIFRLILIYVYLTFKWFNPNVI